MVKRTRGQPVEPRFDGTLAPGRLYGLPLVRTLSDEYRDVAEPEDSDRVPPPEPTSVVRRSADRLRSLVRPRDRTAP